MAIDLKPLSITSMFNNIKAFFQSQENNSKWRDMSTGAEGNFFMRMLANVISVISSRVVIGRREQFHDTASFLSSQIALAVNNGYPVFRGRNQRRRIKLTLNSDINMTIPALSVVGFYDSDYSIITLEEIDPSKNSTEADKTIEFTAVIGALKEIEWQAKTADLKKFVRHEQGISEDYLLFKSDEVGIIPTSKHVKDKARHKYYIYTNPYKSVTIEYLNNLQTAKHKYDNNTVFTLRYVELADMDVEELTADMFTIGVLESEGLIDTYKPFEGIEDIKHNSPVYRERQNLIRSKADWKDAYKDSLPAFKEVTYRALTPTYTQLSYVKDDYSMLRKGEKDYIQENIEPGRYFGRPFPDIEHPKREVITLDVTIGLINTYKYEEDIKADVQGIIDNVYKDTFGQPINIYDVEQELKQLTYVKYARVALHVPERQSFSRYKKGDVITEKIEYGEDDYIERTYICKDILGKSSEVEPSWFDEKVDVDFSGEDIRGVMTPGKYADGRTISEKDIKDGKVAELCYCCDELCRVDGELVWQYYKRIANMGDISPWGANSSYSVGDFVYSETYPNYVMKCVSLRMRTGVNAPDVIETEIGDFIEDGNVVIVRIPDSGEYKERKSKGVYVLGDRFNLSGYSFEVVGFLGNTSGANSIKVKSQTYDLYTIPDDARTVIEEGPVYLDGDFRTYVKQGDLVQISANLTKSSAYEELSEDDLTLSAVIAAEVKEYEDEEEEETPEEDTEPAVTVNTTINMDLSNSLYNAYGLSSKRVPDITGKEIGSFVADYQLMLQCIAYDETLPVRLNSKRYKAMDKFRIAGVDTMAFEVTTLIAAGLSAEEDPYILTKPIGSTVEDFQLLEAVVAYNQDYPLREDFEEYAVGTYFNVEGIQDKSLQVIGITDLGNNISEAKGNPGTITSETTEEEESGGGDEGGEGEGGDDDKPVQNANWKELELVKSQMEQIEEWIISEANDTLRNPADVLAFYASLGETRFPDTDELDRLEEYYEEYRSPDERQIYLYMDQFGVTRKEAKDELIAAGQLPETPWIDKNCVKYYTEDEELRYVDRYGKVTLDEDGGMIFVDDYTPMSSEFAIQREDADGNIIKLIQVSKDNDGNYMVTESYRKTFVTTVTSVIYGAYTAKSVNRFLTCIETTSPIKFYMNGSTINFAYDTTCDGSILWKDLGDLENIDYDWNVYPSIDINLSLKS